MPAHPSLEQAPCRQVTSQHVSCILRRPRLHVEAQMKKSKQYHAIQGWRASKSLCRPAGWLIVYMRTSCWNYKQLGGRAQTTFPEYKAGSTDASSTALTSPGRSPSSACFLRSRPSSAAWSTDKLSLSGLMMTTDAPLYCKGTSTM